MREEVHAAVGFLAKFMKTKLSKDRLEQFMHTLTGRLQRHYSNHWFPDMPDRGSGYRCIRINSNVMDPLLCSAAEESGISNLNSLRLFPEELTMWIDPNDVSYRIGENGSIGQLDLPLSVEPQQSDFTPKSTMDTRTSTYPMMTRSSCKDSFSGLASRFGYPVYAAAFAS